MPSYLQKRRRGWYAVLAVPRKLRPRYGGKVRLLKSLETDSLTDARMKVGHVVADWLAEFQHQQTLPAKAPRATRRRGPDYPEYWRGLMRAAKTPEERDQIMAMLSDAVSDVAAVNDPGYGTPIQQIPEAVEFFSQAMAVSTTDHLEGWLKASRVTASVQGSRRADVLRLAGKFPLLSKVERTAVNKWATELLNRDGLAIGTVGRVFGTYRAYWRYLASVGAVDETDRNPFERLDISRQARREGAREKRRAFDAADVVKLLEAAQARGHGGLADLIALGMWTGCRIEELCSLKVADVDMSAGVFTIRQAKTDAGVRVVPVHTKLRPVLARLVADSRDGFVLTGLTATKYGDRSPTPSKQFSRFRTAMGFGPEVVFHSIRKTVVTMMERAGVPEGTAQDVIGHKRSTLIGRTYSGGTTLEMRRAAVETLNYPASGQTA